MENMSAANSGEMAEILERIGKTFEVGFEALEVDDIPLDVLAIKNMPAHLARLMRERSIRAPLKDLPLWAKVWPASFVLGRFLRKFEPEGKTLLEIGAGMGICAMIASRYGFRRVVASDVAPMALDFARANVLRNNLADKVEVCQLDIKSQGTPKRFPEGFDFIAASEILYLDDLHRPLLKFLARNLAKNGKAFLCTDIARAKPRFTKLAAPAFVCQEGNIRVKSDGPDGAERRVYNILILEKK